MTVRRIIAALLIIAGLTTLGATAAEAAPITCPGTQVAVKVAPGTFACQNNGGNVDGAGKTKNPND